MNRYKIQYRNSNSQTNYHTVYALGESELNKTLVDLVSKGNFIEWIGSKVDGDKLMSFYEIDSTIKLLKELNILEINHKNEDEAYKKWGY